MSKREISGILEDMIDSINRIAAYVRNMSYDEFMADLKTQDAVIRNIEIIGEAAKQLPKSRPSREQRAVSRFDAARPGSSSPKIRDEERVRDGREERDPV